MPVFCFQADTTPQWASCDEGYQWPGAGYWICVDSDAAACSDGPFYSFGSYHSDHEGWMALTGFDSYDPTPNAAWTSGDYASSGGGSESGVFPELSSSDIALLGGKVLLIFALVFSIRIVYSVIMNRR